MKKLKVILELSAKNDIRDSYAWGCEHFGIQGANKWIRELRNAIDSLSTYPNRGPLALENDEFVEEIRQLIVGRYRVLYTVSSESVHILHVRGAFIETLPESPNS